jgi:hypothetical protein
MISGSTLSQMFTATENAIGGYQFVVALNLGTRLDGGTPTGSATVTLSYGSVVIGETTFNAGAVTSGTETQLSFVTQNLSTVGLGGQTLALAITNQVNQQVLVGDVVVQNLRNAVIDNNVLLDGNFQDVNLTSGASGVSYDPVRGDYTGTAPPGWSITSGGAFARQQLQPRRHSPDSRSSI